MNRISLTEPLGTAIERMKSILFRPFDLAKWCALGFTAWLAALGEDGGGGSFNMPSGPHQGGNEFAPVMNFVKEHLAIILAVAAVVVVVAFAVGIVCLWLRGRGKFMFLENVLLNQARVAAPWREFAAQGNSYFVWAFVFGLATLALVLGVLGFGALLVLPALHSHTLPVMALVAALVCVPLLLVVGIGAGVVTVFLDDFVVPLMYKSRLSATQAWRAFAALFRRHVGVLLLYVLFRFALLMGVGIAILMLGCLTCCCGFLVLAIPYIGAVVMLPVSVALRLYSVEFLKQFGPEFDAGQNVPPQLG